MCKGRPIESNCFDLTTLIQTGVGVLLARLPSGEWSGPCLVRNVGGGLGLQRGANFTTSLLVRANFFCYFPKYWIIISFPMRVNPRTRTGALLQTYLGKARAAQRQPCWRRNR